MQKGGRARSIGLTALVAAGIAASFVALGTQSNGIADYYRDTLNPTGFAIWLSGLIVATLSPPIVAIAFWFGAKKARHALFFHLLLVPATYAIVRGAVTIMLVATNEPDSDGLTGWATGPAALLMLLCPIMYYVALCLAILRRRSARANGS